MNTHAHIDKTSVAGDRADVLDIFDQPHLRNTLTTLHMDSTHLRNTLTQHNDSTSEDCSTYWFQPLGEPPWWATWTLKLKTWSLLNTYDISTCDAVSPDMTTCDALQRTLAHCNALPHTATHCNTLQHTATHSNTLQHTATHCNALQRTVTHCYALQRTSTHWHTLQRTTTHCNAELKTPCPNYPCWMCCLNLCCGSVDGRHCNRHFETASKTRQRHCASKRDILFWKRPIILRDLLIIATCTSTVNCTSTLCERDTAKTLSEQHTTKTMCEITPVTCTSTRADRSKHAVLHLCLSSSLSSHEAARNSCCCRMHFVVECIFN